MCILALKNIDKMLEDITSRGKIKLLLMWGKYLPLPRGHSILSFIIQKPILCDYLSKCQMNCRDKHIPKIKINNLI